MIKYLFNDIQAKGIARQLVLLFILSSLSCHFALAQQFISEQSPPLKIMKNKAVTFKTSDEYMLAGDYYPGSSKGGGVLILHDCAHDSENYRQLGEKLSANGVHALALDFRGYGKSSTALFSHERIKTQAKSIVAYQESVATLTSYWETDVLAAYSFLQSKLGKVRGIAVFSIGCSSIYAVALAEKRPINSIVMITPHMDYADKERYKNLIDIPTYFINAIHHTQTFETSKELFQWNGSKLSKIQIFKSDGFDYGLLRSNKYLVEDITYWLKANLESKINTKQIK